MDHCGTKELRTDRLLLRRFTMDDVEPAYRNWASNPEVTKFLTWPTNTSLDHTKRVMANTIRQYEEPDCYYWAICPIDEPDNPFGAIGVIALFEEINTLQVSYVIGQPWWHQGYTSEALSAVMDFLFQEVGAERIEGRHDPRNPNSGRVLRKCGMSYEGTQPNGARNNMGLFDAVWYAKDRPVDEA